MEEMRDYERRLEMQKKIIEEERQRLLQEHAPKLIGFLPKVRIQLILTTSMIRLQQQLSPFNNTFAA